MTRFFLPVLLLLVSVAHAQPGKSSLQKISPSLLERYQHKGGDSIAVSITLTRQVANPQKQFLSAADFTVHVRKIAVHDLDSIASNDNVIFINETYQPKEELTTGAFDLTLNRINYAQTQFPGVNGDSLSAIIKERLADSTDIDLKGRWLKTGLEAGTMTSHASLMATIIAGGANSSPFAKGSATKAKVGSSDFQNLFPDPDSVLSNRKVFLQNHSYGTIVENMYGNEASSYDVQVNANQQLVHVFSAGNSGTTTPLTGKYANMAGVANLTGNFKQAKNIITVGSVDSSGQLMPLSSKGPAYDGRVKPELMAYGEDGSSGAAATVSGAALLVQHAYKKINGQLPSLAVVKSVLINSATDIGRPNVDYESGYGNLDAYKAIATINDNRVIESSLIQGETKSFAISVPANVSKLKLTLSWIDPATLPGSAKALINDLDLVLKHPASSSSWLPWVLDPTPNAAALQSAAQRKLDTLNVVEQVTLDHPVAGNYSIEVKGSRVISSSQSFAIAWQMDMENTFYWTYPSSADHLIAKNIHWLRWETNVAGQGIIEYATNGNNWRNAGTVTDLSSGYFKWQLPDTVTTAVLRMTTQSSGISILSDTFTISPQPSIKTGFNCIDSFLLYWNSLPASQYRLYELGAKYLQPFAQQADTAIVLNKTQHNAIHYAVAPVINGKEGIRSNSVNYSTQGVECYIKNFYLQNQAANVVFLHAEIGSLYNVQEVSIEKKDATGFVVLTTIASPGVLQFLFTDSLLTQGENWYRFKVKLKNGLVFYSNLEVAYNLPASPVIVYPNPVRQNQPFTVLISESGRFSLQVFDDKGRLMHRQELNETITKINAGWFAKGIYFLRIIDKAGKDFSRKLVVY